MTANEIMAQARKEKRTVLTEIEAKQILSPGGHQLYRYPACHQQKRGRGIV